MTLTSQLDNLYISLFSVLGNAVASRHMVADSALVNGLFDLYAHRINLATSRAVLESFQSFWQGSFARVSGLEYEEHVADFLGQLTGALRDFIYVPGLSIPQASLSEVCDRELMSSPLPDQQEESLIRYPHCESYMKPLDVVPPTSSEPIQLDVEMPHASHEYDADVSASLGSAPVTVAPAASGLEPIDEDVDVSRIEETRIEDSPSAVIAESHESESLHSSADHTQFDETGSDVFGPTAATKGKSAKIRKAKKGRRSKKSSQTVNNATKQTVPPTPAMIEPEDILITASDPPSSASPISKKRKLSIDVEIANESQPDESHEVRQADDAGATGANRSFIASASKWLGRLPSIGGLFSPSLPIATLSPIEGPLEPQQMQRSQSDSALVHSQSQPSAPSIPSTLATVMATTSNERPAKRRRQKVHKPETAEEPMSKASPLKTRSGLKFSEGSSRSSKPRLSRSQSTNAVSFKQKVSIRSRSTSVGTIKEEPIIIEDNEVEVAGSDDDELMLSPESARQSRAEEREAIRQSATGSRSPVPVVPAPAPTAARAPVVDADATQGSSGRFDGQSYLHS